MVDLPEELSRHQFVRTVLDEACDIEVTCSDTRGEKPTLESVLWVTLRGHGPNAGLKTLLPHWSHFFFFLLLDGSHSFLNVASIKIQKTPHEKPSYTEVNKKATESHLQYSQVTSTTICRSTYRQIDKNREVNWKKTHIH